MAFKGNKETKTLQEDGTRGFHSRKSYDLNDENDRRIVRDFEAELQPFLLREKIVFGKKLARFELYLHEKGLLRYSENYPHGAVVHNRLRDFNDATMKYQALQQLWDRREYAEKKESENIEQLAAATA